MMIDADWELASASGVADTTAVTAATDAEATSRAADLDAATPP